MVQVRRGRRGAQVKGTRNLPRAARARRVREGPANLGIPQALGIPRAGK